MARPAPRIMGQGKALPSVKEVDEDDPEAEDLEICAEEQDNLLDTIAGQLHGFYTPPHRMASAKGAAHGEGRWCLQFVAGSALLAMALAMLVRSYLWRVGGLPPSVSEFLWSGSTSVGYRWHVQKRGVEVHKELGELVGGLNNSTEGYRALSLLVPQASKCGCRVMRFDQYAICDRAFEMATKAISLRVNGHDHWSTYLQRTQQLVAEHYDCNATQPQASSSSIRNVSAVCVGPREGTYDGRQYTTLSSLLQGAPDTSVHLKMELEESEFGVLVGLPAEDYAKIASLHVEYHFRRQGPNLADLLWGEEVFKEVRQHLVVIDAAAGYYGHPSFVGGVNWPKFLAVSYSAPTACR